MKSVKSLVLKLLRYMVFILGRFVYYAKYMVSLLHIAKVKRRVSKKKQENKVINVIFIIQYVPSWNKLEPIYLKMKEDDRFRPFIVCVPMNVDNHLLKDSKNEAFQYFTERGYEVINALDEKNDWFDLKLLEPDYVFHSRPYNCTMPKCYTSDEIVKYALICNIIYGACITNNAVNTVLNQDYFKNVYQYYAFEKMEQSIYVKRFKLGFLLKKQKCSPIGKTSLESIINAKPERSNMKHPFTILWTPRWSTDEYLGGSNFFKYKDSIFEIAEDNPAVNFIIRPHPLMFENYIKTGEMSEKEVSLFRKKCADSKNLYLDEKKEYTDTFWGSDALITDSSGIIPEYFVTEKPILFCTNTTKNTFTQWTQSMLDTCYQVNDKSDFLIKVNEIINGQDDMKQKRKAVIHELFGNFEKSTELIVDSLYEVGK